MSVWQSDVSDRTYDNEGNPDVVKLVPSAARAILDVGCGAGSNARLLRARSPSVRIVGITRSPDEAAHARQVMDACHVADVELGLPDDVRDERFDAVVFSHVLEHLRTPERVVATAAELLHDGGCVVIAVPNVACWRQRIEFLRGRFEYTESGTMDSTHLRFFTVNSAPRHLLASSPSLRLSYRGVTGSVPLWPLRALNAAKPLCSRIDELGCSLRPNLFGAQVLLRAEKARSQ